MRNRSLLLSAVVFLMALCASTPAIEFAVTIEAARTKEAAASPAEARPMVVMFSSSSCTWCRKMEVDTFPSDEVAAVADQFLWAKVDVEEHEDLAVQYKVRGLPHTVVLNAEDRVIAAQPGYLPPERFVEFLNNARAHPEPIEDILPSLVEKLTKSTDAAERDAVTTEIIERMALAERDGRAEALESLAQVGSTIWPRLVALLSDERLAIRAAACSTLARATMAELPFDPFGTPETRAEQVAAWDAWVKEHAVVAEIEAAPEL